MPILCPCEMHKDDPATASIRLGFLAVRTADGRTWHWGCLASNVKHALFGSEGDYLTDLEASKLALTTPYQLGRFFARGLENAIYSHSSKDLAETTSRAREKAIKKELRYFPPKWHEKITALPSLGYQIPIDGVPFEGSPPTGSNKPPRDELGRPIALPLWEPCGVSLHDLPTVTTHDDAKTFHRCLQAWDWSHRGYNPSTIVRFVFMGDLRREKAAEYRAQETQATESTQEVEADKEESGENEDDTAEDWREDQMSQASWEDEKTEEAMALEEKEAEEAMALAAWNSEDYQPMKEAILSSLRPFFDGQYTKGFKFPLPPLLSATQ